jgi:hypothetical protein
MWSGPNEHARWRTKMPDATISRARMRDLTRLGRSRTGAAPQSGQLTPRTCDLVASPISGPG